VTAARTWVGGLSNRPVPRTDGTGSRTGTAVGPASASPDEPGSGPVATTEPRLLRPPEGTGGDLRHQSNGGQAVSLGERPKNDDRRTGRPAAWMTADADRKADPATTALVGLWRCYARRNLAEAAVRHDSGDLFGAALSSARAEVRAASAELLRRSADPAEAARVMHRTVCELWLTDLPLLGFDAAAVQYTRARTWQDCARTLDPSLPEIQPRLEWT
jgi:hypothetical protein